MFQCHNCGSTIGRQELVNEVFHIENKPVFVEHIPSIVCERCGEKVFSRETTEKVRLIIHGESKPIKSVAVDVFEYA